MTIAFGRLVEFDDQSRHYAVSRQLSPTQQQKFVSKKWSCSLRLDQTNTAACTGFSRAHHMAALPKPQTKRLTASFAYNKIYLPAQLIDEFPGEEPEVQGSSVLAAMKVAVNLGAYNEYHWAFSEAEMALGLGTFGPAVIGINWYADMMDPDSNGFIRPTGENEGGHAILVNGINVGKGYYTVHNSWGASWGRNGEAYISRTDMAELLRQDGECSFATKVPTA